MLFALAALVLAALMLAALVLAALVLAMGSMQPAARAASPESACTEVTAVPAAQVCIIAASVSLFAVSVSLFTYSGLEQCVVAKRMTATRVGAQCLDRVGLFTEWLTG